MSFSTISRRPSIEFALLAAEFIELLFLPLDFLLLPFQVEELFLGALDLDVDFVDRGGGIGRR